MLRVELPEDPLSSVVWVEGLAKGVVLPSQGLLPLHQCLWFGIFSRHRSFKPDEFLGSESWECLSFNFGWDQQQQHRHEGMRKINESWCLDAWHQKCTNEVIERKVWYPGWVCSPLMQQSGAAHPCTRWSIAPWFVKEKEPDNFNSLSATPASKSRILYTYLFFLWTGGKSSANMATNINECDHWSRWSREDLWLGLCSWLCWNFFWWLIPAL